MRSKLGKLMKLDTRRPPGHLTAQPTFILDENALCLSPEEMGSPPEYASLLGRTVSKERVSLQSILSILERMNARCVLVVGGKRCFARGGHQSVSTTVAKSAKTGSEA